MFYDDGSLAHQERVLSQAQGKVVRQDILRCGFLLSDAKCMWEPEQRFECLGYIADMLEGVFRVPERRVTKMMSTLELVWNRQKSVKAREVAAFVGHVLSMRLAIGPVTRLWTRSLYRSIMQAPHYGAHVHLGAEARRELSFWKEHFKLESSFPIWPVCAKADVVSFSDASNVAWAGCFHMDMSEVLAHGNWKAGERGHERSSTWRELRVVQHVIESTINMLHGKNVCHKTDNQNVERIMLNGSRVTELHEEAVAIYGLCL